MRQGERPVLHFEKGVPSAAAVGEKCLRVRGNAFQEPRRNERSACLLDRGSKDD